MIWHLSFFLNSIAIIKVPEMSSFYQKYLIKTKINLQIKRLQVIPRAFPYSNNQRYHESMDNLTPGDVYNGRRRQRLTLRDMIKRETLRARKVFNLGEGGMKKQLQLLRTTP